MLLLMIWKVPEWLTIVWRIWSGIIGYGHFSTSKLAQAFGDELVFVYCAQWEKMTNLYHNRKRQSHMKHNTQR